MSPRDNAVSITDKTGRHRCAPYLNSRGEVIDPAEQDGSGCPVCMPPDGRWHRPSDVDDYYARFGPNYSRDPK